MGKVYAMTELNAIGSANLHIAVDVVSAMSSQYGRGCGRSPSVVT